MEIQETTNSEIQNIGSSDLRAAVAQMTALQLGYYNPIYNSVSNMLPGAFLHETQHQLADLLTKLLPAAKFTPSLPKLETIYLPT
ncbi:hypothetical protein CR513_31419, partial [Mucuna pruriens]